MSTVAVLKHVDTFRNQFKDVGATDFRVIR